MKALVVKGVTKRFGDRLVLDDVTFEVEAGESVLLMGANGAGKTTLLRCILGLLRFEGSIEVLGLDVKNYGKNVRKHIGYVPQHVRLQPEMTVYEMVDFVSDMKGVDVSLEEVLGPLGLTDMAEKKVGALSGGMIQRLAISLSMIGDPALLLMDEPFSNLDAASRNAVHEILKTMMKKGKTIVVSVHTVSGLIHLFEKVVLLKDGRLAGVMSADEVLRLMRPVYRVHVRTGDEWTTYRTEDLFAILSELQSSQVRDAWVEEPDVEELLRRIST